MGAAPGRLQLSEMRRKEGHGAIGGLLGKQAGMDIEPAVFCGPQKSRRDKKPKAHGNDKVDVLAIGLWRIPAGEGVPLPDGKAQGSSQSLSRKDPKLIQASAHGLWRADHHINAPHHVWFFLMELV